MTKKAGAALVEDIRAVYDEHGRLTGQLVVDAWRDPSHPAHDRLEWDDAVAGEAHRVQQAKDLIRICRVVYREAKGRYAERSVRQYHSVPTPSGPEARSYEPADKVAEDPLLRQLVLRDMERDWRQLKDRYSRFDEFVEMVRRDLDEDAA